MSTKRVFLVITKSAPGGAGRYVFDIATHLPSQFEPTVVAGGSGALFEKLNEAHIRTISLQSLERDFGILKDLQACFDLYKLFKKEKPDIIHLNSSKVGGLGSLAGRMAGVPRIIFTVHGFAWNESWRPLYQRVLIWIASFATAVLSHETIVVAEREKHQYPLASKTTVIHNGVETAPALEKSLARESLQLPQPSAGVLVGTIAELHKNKGLDVLITAMQDVRGAQLAIVGDGEERGTLKDLTKKLNLEDRVFLLGQIPSAAKYLHAFDLFVLPSRKEGLPYVILEAGSSGIPVIATKVGGIPEIITDETGVLVQPNNPAQLTLAIQRLVDNENDRELFGLALKTKVEKEFSLASMIEKTVALY